MKTKQTGAWLTGLLLLAPLAARSAADLSVGRDKLPSFSWERVPRYVHIRKDTAFTADEIGKEKKAELMDGYTLMMKDARRILGPEKLMVANVLRARFPDSGMSRLRAFDGSYMEGFEATVDNVPLKDYMAKGIAAFQQAARQGFLIAFTAGLGEEASDVEVNNPQRTDEIRKSLTRACPKRYLDAIEHSTKFNILKKLHNHCLPAISVSVWIVASIAIYTV